TFSEAVTGFTSADLTVQNGTVGAFSSADGGITWTGTLTAASNIADTTNVITLDNTGVVDLAGNAGVGTTNSNNYVVNDTVAPTATIVVADTALKSGETSAVTITFSEAVTGFTTADLTVANGIVTGLSSSDGGITWTATLTPDADVTDTTNLVVLDKTGVADLSGNAGVGTTNSNNYAIDTLRPTATIVVADTALSVGETSLVTITFNEAVTGFTTADLTVANGTVTGLSSSDGGITWTGTLTPTASISDTSNLITLANSGVADLSGNAGTGTTDSNNYAIDTLRPTATIVVADTALSVGETSLVTITFSEAVSGFTLADLTVANGSLSGLSSADGGITWTATLTPSASVTDASNLIVLANTGIQDAAGNAGTGTTNSNNYAIDTQRPTASIVVADTTLSVGETSLVTITFSEAVTGFTTADLTVANGTVTGLSSGDGGITWTGTFTPSASTTDATNLITLDNTGVSDAAGNAGSGTTDSNNYAIDNVRPTATVVIADTALAAGETSLVTITFSEAVTGFTLADLTAANGSLSGLSTSDNITYTATFTPSVGVNDTSNLITLDNTGVVDGVGNAGTGTTDSNNYIVDTQRPTATIVVADNALSVGETSLVTITFSEAVSGFDNSDLSVANGTLSAVSSSDGGITWTATLTPNLGIVDTTNVIVLSNTGFSDAAGNTGTGTTSSNNYQVDTNVPTATIVVADSSLSIGETSLVTITFNEAVNGFDNSDLTISNGTLTNVSSSDGGVTWTATFTPSVGVSDTSNLITLDNTGVRNGASNAGVGTTDSNNYAVDTVRPTATVVVADTAIGAGETSLVTITFSEAVTAFTAADLTVANGTVTGLSSSDGGITWTATFTPSAGINDTSNVITLTNGGIADLAGNIGTGTTDSNNYAIDTQRPTATIVLNDSTLRPGETALVTITFSEAVTGFTNADLSVANGSLSAVSSSDGGLTWTATFTPTVGVSDATNLIVLDNTGVSDAAGNAGTGTTNSANYAVETQVPTATVVVADNSLTVGETSLVTITFSEAVSGFDNADLSVSNGTLSNVSSSDGGVTWTATFTPSTGISDTSNLISLDTSGVVNVSGNSGAGVVNSNNYAVDTVRPGATIVVGDTSLGIGQTTTVTISFTEAVTGFDLSDLSVANGVLSNLASSDGGLTWTATLTPTAGVNDATNLILLDASTVQDIAGNAGAGIAISSNYVLDATRPSATIVVADSNLTVGETTQVTITFSEAVAGFDLSDLSVTNGELTNLTSSDGGKTWTATFTPTANLTDPSNFIALDTSNVSDGAGNAGASVAVSNNYAIDTVVPNDVKPPPEFLTSDPVTVVPPSDVPLQPIVFTPPTGDLGSPLGFPPLFEQRDVGGGLRPIGDIFINRGELAPSYIAQVFSTDAAGDGSGQGFLGFGGGDGGVFGSSTISTLFNHDSGAESESMDVFGNSSMQGGDVSQGIRGMFGAPTLGQQLQHLKDTEQRQVDSLAMALQQVGVSQAQA
ncbi:S-layer family protein, partial [Pseudomonas sp. SHC52]